MSLKLRFPAIVTPAQAGRDVKDTVSQIRQRITALEDALLSLTATSQAGIQSLKVAAATTTTTTTTTSTIQTFGTVGAIAGNTAVYLVSSGVVGVSDPTVLAQSFGCIGVTQGIAAAGQTKVAVAGAVITVPVGTFVSYMPVFAGAGGQLTQSPPSAPAVIQVGVALGPGSVLVAPAPTLLASTALTNVVDDLLPITRNPGVIWQFNGVQVAARRIADFVAGAGFTMAMQDDPGNNRVIITFGAAVAPSAAQVVEDGWPWGNPDGLVDDEWESWQDDSQANSSTVTPSAVLAVEDNVDPEHETADEWDLWGTIETLGASLPAVVLSVEDAWSWDFDLVADDWESWQDDSFANASTVVGSAVLSVEDAWLDPDDIEEDLWIRVAQTTTGWNQNG
jgi:hypothetical protein